MRRFLILFLLFGLAAACDNKNGQKTSTEATPQPAVFEFDTSPVKLADYWYQGKAEINRYELQQNRYDGIHEGEAVAIFVTEDFLTDKQVKNDNYTNPNSTPILKTNLLRKFPTGLYDYSIMTSVFTPTKVNKHPQTLKVTTTAQDWCGHAFMQVNFQNQQYQMQLRSYFEDEGDQNQTISYAILEDELFNRVRIDPKKLPSGKIEIIPSTAVLRLKHLPFRAYTAKASLADYEGSDFSGEQLKVYTLEYPKLDRKLQIVFEYEPPYRIEGWKDTYPSVFDKQARTTLARRTHTILSPYWKLNSPEDRAMRRKLGLDIFPAEERVERNR
jgi:hypothetical protein